MSNFNYSLDNTSYSWHNAFLWGNFVGHCKKAREGSLGNRVVHILIAAMEFLPIISQISSICEKLIVENYSSMVSHSKRSLANRQILKSASKENHEVVPFSEYKKILLASLSKTIENQRIKETYKRPKFASLQEQSRNLPIPLSSTNKKVKCFSENAIFYGYNAEGIRDYGWGCAWRAIQTCLSTYKINSSFEELFHLFGPYENLNHIYGNKYPKQTLPDEKKFPYELTSGWAEPFIGHMVMHFYDIPSALETVNGIPGCNSPQDVFHNEPLTFATFRASLEDHFKAKNAAPIMIDDGLYALNIVGVEIVEIIKEEEKELNTILWIADPHIKGGVNKLIEGEKSPNGLYTVTLDPTGKKRHCSLDDEDKHQTPNMFNAGSYNGLHFESKRWMILFPLNS